MICIIMMAVVPLLEALLIRDRKEQLIAIGIVDLDHVITPPRFLVRNRALDDFMAKICKPFRGQIDENRRALSLRMPSSQWRVPLHSFAKPCPPAVCNSS